ncbi:MAG: hypothetical protein JKY43_02915 [Phycisphaerales bacterium]|nr:hypothetical protein [Phycisphaerales bacterium]
MDSKLRIVICLMSGLSCCQSLAQVSSERAADSMEIVVGLDLGLNEPATPADYTLAMHVLTMAMELDPRDADLARSAAEAAWMAGDHEELIRATRSIVRNDPKDTVAQLRLISAVVNREQTVEARIHAYGRFLGERGESIDPSVRSRLALDMALLERERGNEVAFLTALRRSGKLDPSNKAAQSLIAQHYSIKIERPSTRMRLQLRVLYADPLDPHVHIAIARMCAAEGATDAAWRFLKTGIQIFQIDTGSIPPAIQEQQLSLLWQNEGPQAILDRLNPSLADERATTQARIDARIAADEPIDDLTPPMDIRYEPGIDRIRLLAAFILHDQETVDSVLLDLENGLVAYFVAAQEQMGVRGANRGALLGAYLSEVVTFQTMRAIVGVDAEVIKTDMGNIIESVPELERFFRPFEPFSKFAAGEYENARDQAIEKLAPSAPRDLLIALISERLNNLEESIKLYTQLTLDYPLQAAGAIARSRLEELTDGADMTTPEGVLMGEIADGVPVWLEKMITNPENTMSLRIKPTKTSFEAGESARLTIRLSNLSALPMSLGSAHPIDSNLLIVPGFREIDSDFQGVGRAKVVDLGRRLRLMPLEELVIEIDPDSVQTKWLIQTQPQSVIRQRWRALQGFKPLPTGGIVNSPFALVSESPLVERRVLGEVTQPVDMLIEGIGGTDRVRMERSILGAAAILYSPSRRPELTDEDFGRLVDALWGRYDGGDTATKVWMLGVLPTKVASVAMASFDERVQQTLTSDSLIEPEIDPVLVAMVLLTRVETMGSPVFDVARLHRDSRLGWIADFLFERIDGIKPMYAGTDRPFETFAPGMEEALGY